MSEQKNNAPTHEVFAATGNNLYKIGALWPTKNSTGLSGDTVFGRIVVLPRKAKAETDAASATLTGEEFLEYLDSRITR